MKFKHSFLTPILLFILTSCIICFSFIYVGKYIFAKENIIDITKNINIAKIIREEKALNDILEEKKIPKEVLDYLDNEKSRELLKKIIDSLYTNNSSIIKETDISTLIKDSIINYENLYDLDIYDNIEEDINNFSLDFSNQINNKEIIDSFRSVYKFLNGITFYIVIIITILSIIGIIFLEKKESILILGIIFFIFSIIINYLKDTFIEKLLEDKVLLEYIQKQSILKTEDFFKQIYLTSFVIGIILLLIYLVIFIKKLLLKIRLMKYDRYYRR